MIGITSVQFRLGKKAYIKRDENGRSIKNPETGKFIYNAPVPVVTTYMTFSDGSKVSVSNTEADPVELDKDGRIPQKYKELGIIYAVMKRLSAKSDGYGLYYPVAFSTMIDNIIAMSDDLNDKIVDNRLKAAERRKKEVAEKQAQAEKPDTSRANKKTKCKCNNDDVIAELRAQIAELSAKLEDRTIE